MNNENELCSFKNGVVLGVSLGILSGVAATIWLHKKRTINPDTILTTVKHAFLKEGPIEGSWIECKQKPLQKFAVYSTTYQGGILRMEDGHMTQYEFIADAQTGTVIDVQRLTMD